MMEIPYARHHKPLLITSRSWIQAIHKDRIFCKNLLKNKEMVFENGVKNIQAAAYDGARTLLTFDSWLTQLPGFFVYVLLLHKEILFRNFWVSVNS